MTLDEWAGALGSRVAWRRRLELASACPVCGGEDRFHVRIMPSGRTLAGCRGCIDGRPKPDRQAAYGAVLQALGCKPSEPSRNTVTSAIKADNAKLALAVRLWEAAGAADKTPAVTYLANRGVWPPERTLPVRWLPATTPIAVRLDRLPAGTAGLMIFDWRQPGNPKLQAVSLEALTAAGQRTNPRWRRTRGSKRGCVFSVPIQRNPGDPLHLCEGEADALAIRTWRKAEAWAVGGTGGFEAIVPMLPTDREICIEADAGGPGGRAAAATLAAIRGQGGKARIEWTSDDPAADLSADWFERAAIIEHEGVVSRTEAEHLAWEAMMQDKS